MSQPKFYSASFFFLEEYSGNLGEQAVHHLSMVWVELREIIAIYELHQVEESTAETYKWTIPNVEYFGRGQAWIAM